MNKIEIKCRFSGNVLFSHEADNNSMRITLEAAVSAGANLAGAYLAGANLDGAYLAGANLAGANLAGANLAGAYLDGAYLDGANLAGANLAGAYLAGAYLAGANLDGAYLDGDAKLVGSRPIVQIGPIGSRCAYFVAYLTDKGLRLRAGCFFGSREKFEKKLANHHGDGEHAQEYRAALALIDKHAELWTPAASVEAAAPEAVPANE
jgi:uncharacterized protein YjbI with pentapeptide repeats